MAARRKKGQIGAGGLSLTESSCPAVAATIFVCGCVRAVTTDRSLSIEECTQARMAGTADGKLRACTQDSDMTVFAVGFNLGHAFEIHDIRTVNAQKS